MKAGLGIFPLKVETELVTLLGPEIVIMLMSTWYLVLACLRSLIRKCVRENFTSDDILKLFPPDLSLDLQSILILLLQKYQNQWKEEMAREQHPVPRTSVSYHVRTSVPPSFTSVPSSVISTPLWPHQDDPVTNFNHYDLGASIPVIADNTVARLSPMILQRDASPPDNLRNLPSLKSMTWTMEKSNSVPADRVAVINFKVCHEEDDLKMDWSLGFAEDLLEPEDVEAAGFGRTREHYLENFLDGLYSSENLDGAQYVFVSLYPPYVSSFWSRPEVHCLGLVFCEGDLEEENLEDFEVHE
ncbi:hypothetical protein JRO89_XS04G0100200 [Xanthoceras sorbifolium]|uniref:Uncharacterized protein n=1 Tax=Xanthoceras sorbifolium TaxID=99658 RepID=A0ABQ8I4P4_9ROSI|nr:hypothetical protein JRO89_XS04G0100200 [Xanthoceras sorbifolium]